MRTQRLPRPPPLTRRTDRRRERQKKFKTRTTNRLSNRVTQYARQPIQWCHVSIKYWRERRQLGLCRVVLKLTHEPGKHTGTWEKHQWTGVNARGCRGIPLQTRMTNGVFLSHWQTWTSRARRCRDQTAGKPLRKWRHADGQHPAISAALTPVRRLGGPSHAYTTPTCWGRQRRPSSARGIPPIHPSTRRQLHAIWRLPGLVAPKSRIPLGWRNSRRQ